LIGGLPRSLGTSFKKAGARKLASSTGSSLGRAVPFVLEGDEYDTAYWEKTAKFLHYGADVAILTSIEHDHIDIYPRFEDYRAAFERFVRQLPQEGLLIAYAGDKEVVQVCKAANCEVAYYALGGEDTHGVAPHWLAEIAEEGPSATTFDLFAGGVAAGRFVTPLPGAHNLRNALAAIGATAQGYGAPLKKIALSLSSFEGVQRRQELKGSPGKIQVYDDFAHHPTAVAETLKGLRNRHPGGRMIAVFEPRSATACRKLHQEAYVSAFDRATHVLLAPVGRPELPADEILDIEELVRALGSRKGPSSLLQAEALDGVEAIVTRIVELAEPGDTVVVLSNGAFGGIHEKLLAALTAAHHPKASGEDQT
jgi:UDP-N-acetylmuramate: L-alanyl-gamma-D-glutamyl-meso-diaminopimelate ligase